MNKQYSIQTLERCGLHTILLFYFKLFSCSFVGNSSRQIKTIEYNRRRHATAPN